jgi:hypothetical protein
MLAAPGDEQNRSLVAMLMGLERVGLQITVGEPERDTGRLEIRERPNERKVAGDRKLGLVPKIADVATFSNQLAGYVSRLVLRARLDLDRFGALQPMPGHDR